MPPDPPSGAPVSRSIYAGLFALAASVLVLEIALTRVFSVLLWGHYGFLVISTALLGFGAAGSWLSLRRRAFDPERTRRFLWRNCALFAVSLVLCVMLCTRLGYQPSLTFVDPVHTALLPLMYGLLAVPFFFAGLAIGHLLSSFAADINAIYFSDLLGAGVGALGVTFLLGSIGAPAALLAAGTLALVAGLVFLGHRLRAGHGLAALAYAAFAAFVALRDPWTIPVPETKSLHPHRDEVVDSRWGVLARVDVLEESVRPLNFGSGASRAFSDRRVRYRSFYMDGSNPSRMIRHGQDPWFADKLLSASPYGLGLDAPRVLIIGSGGGIDTLVALENGAESVTAVEINPRTVELVLGDYAAYLGDLFRHPDVELVNAEGRHFLTLDRGEYELIRLTGVDTRAASAIGANAQDHAYLYTVEAIRDLYAHLASGGVLAITRTRDWQSNRLLATVLAGLESLGVEEPARHMAVVHNGRWSDLLVCRSPLEPREVRALVSWASDARMEIDYDPFHERDSEAASFLALSPAERAAHVADARVNLRPVTDDSPFFFQPRRLGAVLAQLLGLEGERGRGLARSGYATLLVALAGAVVFSLLFVLAPLAFLRTRAAGQSRAWSTSYFALLGLGFILAELIFIQKYMIFLGGPVHSLSVTLFAILVFSGLGAFAARRLDVASPALRLGLPVGVVLVLLATSAFLRWGLPGLLGLGFPARVLLGIASLAPASFLMGMPFPLGIRVLERTAPDLVAWAWGTNACLTVIGSVLSVILALEIGFFAALLVAAGCYALAGVCLLRMRVAPAA